MNYELAERLGSTLSAIRILPRRILLDTPGVAATVPMLRGVWGAALHDLEPTVYAAVFAPNDGADRGNGHRLTAGHLPPHRAAAGLAQLDPEQGADRRIAAVTASGTAVAGYILRPAPPDPQFAPALDWILIGDAVQHDFTLCRAWDVASGLGLGPQRHRFHLRRTVALRPDGQTVDHAAPWPLSTATWPATNGHLRNAASDQPCRLIFPVPLRLMFRKQLVESPTLADIVVAACRRVKAYLPAEHLADWDESSRWALETARETPAEPWQGQRLDLHRYSGRQHAELELRGVTGYLDLPRGPGELWPLLAAAQWLHLGKGTVMGMGQLVVGQ
jgi:hypothetical protein